MTALLPDLPPLYRLQIFCGMTARPPDLTPLYRLQIFHWLYHTQFKSLNLLFHAQWAWVKGIPG